MEFNEKIQELRRQRGLTQEELASLLFVSRTAVSKWESGRGYPSIDSLREIAKFFNISLDELLSSDELLTLASEENKKKSRNIRDLLFGFLDIFAAVLFFLPFFGETADGVINAVSLLSLTTVSPYLITLYFVFTIALILWGVLILALQKCALPFWTKIKTKVSVILSLCSTIIFIISLQPYAAVYLILFLIIKVLVLIKK